MSQQTLDKKFEAPTDPQIQRHEFFHRPGCDRAPSRTNRVNRREAKMMALQPCPTCRPTEK